MICGMLKSYDGFMAEGCTNCESLVRMQGSTDRVMEGTSGSWSGVVGVVTSEGSWVARWQRLERRAPGMYAIKVVGRLSEDLQDICQARSIRPVVVDR